MCMINNCIKRVLEISYIISCRSTLYSSRLYLWSQCDLCSLFWHVYNLDNRLSLASLSVVGYDGTVHSHRKRIVYNRFCCLLVKQVNSKNKLEKENEKLYSW